MAGETARSLTDVRLDEDERGLTLCTYDGIAKLPPQLGEEGTVTRHLRYSDVVPARCLYDLMLGALRRVLEANAKLADLAGGGGEPAQAEAAWAESLEAQAECDRLEALAEWCAE